MGITFEHEHLAHYSGQDNYELGIYENGEVVGYVQYTVFKNQITINDILVRPDRRREKFGSILVKKMKSLHPEAEYIPSLKTDLGSKFIHKDVALNEQIYKIKKIMGILNEAHIDSSGNLIGINYHNIDEIFKGYIECALWTEEDNLKEQGTYDEDNEDDDEDNDIEKLIKLINKHKTKRFESFVIDDIDEDSLIEAYNDIKKFIDYAGSEAIDEAVEINGLFKLGMDIWFTRNGHGSGFFDHSYENEDALIEAGKKLNPVDLYVGDDNKLYFS